MNNFVLGFAFTPDEQWVALIEKKRPAWQIGLLNGIGGRIEPGERPEVAMIREFEEETGFKNDSGWKFWDRRGEMLFDDAHIYVFSAIIIDLPSRVHTTTDEEVVLYPVNNLPPNVIDNLRWLIPACLDRRFAGHFSFRTGHIANVQQD